MAMISFFLFAVNSIFIISVIFETVTSNPAPVGRWGHPCHGRTAVRQPVLVTPSTEPETDDVVAQKLFIKAQEIIQLTNVIKANYVSTVDIQWLKHLWDHEN